MCLLLLGERLTAFLDILEKLSPKYAPQRVLFRDVPVHLVGHFEDGLDLRIIPE